MDNLVQLNESTLKSVNNLLIAFDSPPIEDLPKGKRFEHKSCSLYKALQGIVQSVERQYVFTDDSENARTIAHTWGMPYAKHHNGWAIRTPAELSSFIEHFDLNHYPDLVLDNELALV